MRLKIANSNAAGPVNPFIQTTRQVSEIARQKPISKSKQKRQDRLHAGSVALPSRPKLMFAEAAQYFATTILELGDTGSTQKRRKRTFSDDLSYRSPRSVTISKTGQ
jgi:hypothetical protein